jgi:hypothetical protein
MISSAVNVDWIAGKNQLLRPIVLACDEAATLVMKTLSTGANRPRIRVQDDDCRMWLENLLMST